VEHRRSEINLITSDIKFVSYSSTIADINGASYYIIKNTKLWNTEIPLQTLAYNLLRPTSEAEQLW